MLCSNRADLGRATLGRRMVARLQGKLVGVAVSLLALLGVGWALAEFNPVLHEQFDADPKEDLELGVRVTASGLPAAIKAQSGAVPLPDPARPVDRNEPTYGERQTDAVKRFRIDRETTDPGRLTYHEPFRPSIAPFKRTHVFDAVNAEFDLTVSDSRLRPVTIAGAPLASDDQFFGDLVLELVAGEMVRVPSAGPHMTIYSAHLEPETPFGFYVDRAENWFLRAPEGRAKARLVMHVGVARAAFDGRIEATSYSALVSELPQVPANVEQVVMPLVQRIGVSRVLSPAEALERLVTHFRSFAESRERPAAAQGEALYRELVASRKGVCRHRAYAFVVTALGLGIPARFVHNEAHAWVEVYGGVHWHRIDLGGAASGIDYRGEAPAGAPHRPPAEVFAWPKRAQAAEQSLSPSGSEPSSSGQSAAPAATMLPLPQGQPTSEPATLPSTANSIGLAPAVPLPTAQAPAARGRGRVIVALTTSGEVQRGQELGLTGRVEAGFGNCANVRVDIGFVRQSRSFLGGSLMTDGDGRFTTKLTVPAELPVGKYDLVASTPGSKGCPAASSE